MTPRATLAEVISRGSPRHLMYPWRSAIGTAVLASALLAHYSNALWSIYVRRHLRLSRWEWWQLSLGLCIPLLLMFHVIGTRVAEGLLGVTSHYSSVLLLQWQLSPWLGVLQATAVEWVQNRQHAEYVTSGLRGGSRKE